MIPPHSETCYNISEIALNKRFILAIPPKSSNFNSAVIDMQLEAFISTSPDYACQIIHHTPLSDLTGFRKTNFGSGTSSHLVISFLLQPDFRYVAQSLL